MSKDDKLKNKVTVTEKDRELRDTIGIAAGIFAGATLGVVGVVGNAVIGEEIWQQPPLQTIEQVAEEKVFADNSLEGKSPRDIINALNDAKIAEEIRRRSVERQHDSGRGWTIPVSVLGGAAVGGGAVAALGNKRRREKEKNSNERI